MQTKKCGCFGGKKKKKILSKRTVRLGGVRGGHVKADVCPVMMGWEGLWADGKMNTSLSWTCKECEFTAHIVGSKDNPFLNYPQ